jgi:predicted transcriptional regulator
MATNPLVKNKGVLELETRRKIYELVSKFAGNHFRDIERKCGLSASSVRYHLNYLNKRGLISEEKDGSNLRYYPKEFNFGNKKLLSLLRQNSLRKILLFVLNNKSCNQDDISRFVGLSSSTVSWHLKKLINHEIIEDDRNGRKVEYRLLIDNEEVVNLLITYKESFFDSLVDKTIEMWDVR